jgi:phage FluMu gp28-like protein
MSIVGWRLIHRLALQVPGAEIRRAERSIMIPTGGEMWVRSADNPDSLRGEGLDFAVLDESAFMKEAAWAEAIRPALSDRQGRAMFISTPKGRNFFWRLWQRCQDDKQDEWEGWQLPTSDNPYIADEEIEAAKATMPERIFQQEYLAMFIDDSGGVFRRITEAATAIPLLQAEDGGQYIIGADWGRSNDFTVFTVIDVRNKMMVYSDRFTQIDYNIQANRLRAVYNRFPDSQIIAEYNSMGGPIVERLQAEGLPVTGFVTTNKTKEQIIRGLENAFENAEISILNDPILIGELQAYEQERMASGWKFGAPEGMHDDMVISLALAWHGINSSRGPWRIG